MALLVSEKYVNNFRSKTAPGTTQPHMDTPCTLWTAGKYETGYGQFFAGEKVRAHRYAYIVAHGPIPEGLCVCHRCDVRDCVNPDHLYLGTQKDNMRDRMEREGYATVPKGDDWYAVHGADTIVRGNAWHAAHDGTVPKGEAHHMTSLTEQDVRDIRASYIPRRNGGLRALGERFGLTLSGVYAIVTGKTWAHVV